MGAVTRVLICEDSRTYAAGLARLLESDGDIEIAAICPTAEQAIELLPDVQPDLVTMDIELPGISGIDAVEQIMNAHPVPIMVLSSHVERNSGQATAALAAGALDAVPKDELDLLRMNGSSAASFRKRVKLLSAARVIRHPRARLRRPRERTVTRLRTASVVGICASTGGPQALRIVLSGLPESFPIPLLVVQHIAAGFTEGLTRWLDNSIRPPVHLAKPGARLGPGVWIAPEGAHLVVRPSKQLALDRDTISGHHRPSADVLFKSMARVEGAGAVAVVLTGMGRDGADGLSAVSRAGGLTIAQDEQSSVIFGMPKVAAEKGAQLILSPPEIADVLSALLPRKAVA